MKKLSIKKWSVKKINLIMIVVSLLFLLAFIISCTDRFSGKAVSNAAITCSKVSDSICPSGCNFQSDADCCIKMGRYWLQTAYGFECYMTNYNPGCSPGQKCGDVADGCCPNWCGDADIDCCSKNGKYWLQTPTGSMCYSTNYNPGCSAGQKASNVADNCCPNWAGSANDADCCANANKCWGNGRCNECVAIPGCTDTDITDDYKTGLNYGVMGTVNGYDWYDVAIKDQADYCLNNKILFEYFCDDQKMNLKSKKPYVAAKQYYCPDDNYCDNETRTCVDPNPDCTNECTAEQRQCTAETSYKMCGNYDADACLEFSIETPCAQDEKCKSDDGTCMCVDMCSGGEKQCIADKTGYQICGNYDVDSCREFSIVVTCAQGEKCQNGACNAKTACNDPDGLNIETGTTVTWSRGPSAGGSSADFCYLDNQLVKECKAVKGCEIREAYCETDGVLKYKSHVFDNLELISKCPGGCIDGACNKNTPPAPPTAPSCKDSDGDNIDTKGCVDHVYAVSTFAPTSKTEEDYCNIAAPAEAARKGKVEQCDALDKTCSIVEMTCANEARVVKQYSFNDLTVREKCPGGCINSTCNKEPDKKYSEVADGAYVASIPYSGAFKKFCIMSYPIGYLHSNYVKVKSCVPGDNCKLVTESASDATQPKGIQDCPAGCSNGDCINLEADSCTDSDITTDAADGKNYYLAGKTRSMYGTEFSDDKCMLNDNAVEACSGSGCKLREMFCGNEGLKVNWENYECPKGCSAGRCSDCSDSDVDKDYPDGKNYFVAGTVKLSDTDKGAADYCTKKSSTAANIIYLDSCSGADCGIAELYCDGAKRETVFSECRDGCELGRCLPKGESLILDIIKSDLQKEDYKLLKPVESKSNYLAKISSKTVNVLGSSTASYDPYPSKVSVTKFDAATSANLMLDAWKRSGGARESFMYNGKYYYVYSYPTADISEVAWVSGNYFIAVTDSVNGLTIPGTKTLITEASPYFMRDVLDTYAAKYPSTITAAQANEEQQFILLSTKTYPLDGLVTPRVLYWTRAGLVEGKNGFKVIRSHLVKYTGGMSVEVEKYHRKEATPMWLDSYKKDGAKQGYVMLQYALNKKMYSYFYKKGTATENSRIAWISGNYHIVATAPANKEAFLTAAMASYLAKYPSTVK